MSTPDDPRDERGTGGGSPPPPEDPPGGAPGPDEAPDPDERTRILLEPYLRIIRRALRSVRAFFAAHVIVVRTEAEQELVRVLGGLSLLFGTAVFLLTSAILAGAASVALVQRLTALPWLESIAIAMGATLLVALVLGGIAWLRLRKPLMPRSRELMQKTIDGLGGR